jgi:tetratricopeptide (TPR) repeat protein
MRTYTALIYPYFASGLPEKAAEAARQALRLETRVEEPEQLACMHLAVARSLLYEGHHDDALQSLRKAEEIYEAGGWRNRVAKVQLNEAIVLAKKENFGEARDKLLAAWELLETSPNRLDQALALNELGHVTRHLEDAQSALDYLERAKGFLEEGDIIEMAFNERELGICLAPTEPKIAENHLKNAVDLYRISGATAELATTFKALGDLYAARGETDLALDALREGLAAVEERSA